MGKEALYKKQEHRKKISDALSIMEQGQFQDFCLDFLPICSLEYKGLKRFGTTADGKTRKGTPDLIKTLDTGQQIAVECSTQKKYWKIPKNKDKYAQQWKPCKDVDKCIEKLNSLQEIVLCSNKEIPTDSQNAEAEIILYAKRRTEAKITLFCCSKIAEILINSFEKIEFENIFKIYFPERYKQLCILKELQAKTIAIELAREKPIKLDIAEQIAKTVSSFLSGYEEAKEIALKKVDELKSRFERDSLPDIGKVKRFIPEGHPLLSPIGKVQTLLGIPKIGKTTLVAQYVSHWKSVNLCVRWFDCPYGEPEVKNLIEDISKATWSLFLPPRDAIEIARGIIRPESIKAAMINYSEDMPTIYVLDNAENLLVDSGDLLNKLLMQFKVFSLFTNIGFVLISNKSLKHLSAELRNESSIAAWTKTEIKEFLLDQLPEHECIADDKYLEILQSKSSGHPLLARALVRKYPSKEKILISYLEPPSLADEELAAEIKHLLFEDILSPDKDLLTYVLRLSVLIFRAKDKVLHAIAKRINPQIVTPFSLILDKLLGTVIEGDSKQGFSVSSIYKDIAREKINPQEKQEIYNVISDELLSPSEGVIDASKAIEGINYALLSGNFVRVFLWTTLLLQAAHEKEWERTQISNVLDRLEIVAFIITPKDTKLLIGYYLMLVITAMCYHKINKKEKAIDLLNKVVAPVKKDSDEKLNSHLNLLCEMAKIFKMFLFAENDRVKAVEMLPELTMSDISNFSPETGRDLKSFSKDLISVIPIKDLPKDVLKKIIYQTDINDDEAIANLLKIVSSLGIKGNQEGVGIEELESLFPSENALGRVLCLVLKAQYLLDKQKGEDSLKLVQQAIELCQKNSLLFDAVESELKQLEADVYYKLNDSEQAGSCYLRCLECMGSSKNTFDYAWANYRLGLLSDDLTEAENYLAISSSTFDAVKYDGLCAKNEGERGVVLVKLGRFVEFVRVAEWMARRYYLRNKSSYAPSITIMMAHLARLTWDIKKESIPEARGATCPEFRRGIYAEVLDVAKPQCGGVETFYSLANCYGLLGNMERKKKCLYTALRYEGTGELALSSKFLTIRDLLLQIGPDGCKDEIKSIMLQGILVSNSGNELSMNFMSLCVFFAFDDALASLDIPKKKTNFDLLNEIENALDPSEHKNIHWWLAEIYMRKTQLIEGSSEKQERYRLLKMCYDSACKCSHATMIIGSGYKLGFEFCEFAKGIKELATMHSSILKAVISSNANLENNMAILGKNLFVLWKGITYTRLSEHDLKFLQFLNDGAKTLDKAGFTSSEATPIMILLLATVCEHEEKDVIWAKEKIKAVEHKIPKSISKKITFLD